MKPRPRPGEYHLLGIAAKQRQWLRIHDAPIRCTACTTQVMQTDLPSHERERCAGSRQARDEQLVGEQASHVVGRRTGGV